MTDFATRGNAAETNGDAANVTPGNPLARLTSLTRTPASTQVGMPHQEAPRPGAAIPTDGPAASEPAAQKAIELPAATPAPDPEPRSAPTTVHPTFGRLERVQPDRIWAGDEDFARWLAANLDTLGETLGTTFSGGATVDGSPIVVADEGAGRKAAILTERGESTDAGFGMLLRQVAASQADRAIWICARPRDDHGASVSWLNRSIDGRFEVVRVEVVTIGGSAAAPTFEVVVRPSRGDDPGVEAVRPSSAAPPEPGRRADDWLAEPGSTDDPS